MSACQELRDYLDWQCHVGRGDYRVLLDPDSILSVATSGEISVHPARPEYIVDEKNKTVFVRVAFEDSKP